MTRGDLISAQVTSFLEKEVGREIIEVCSLAMPTEVTMGPDYLVAPVFILEERQCWFLPASKQKDVVLHTASSRPVELLPRRCCGYLNLYRSSKRDGTSMWKRDPVRITK